MIPSYADQWGDEIIAKAEAKQQQVEPPPPFRVTDAGIVVREDVLADAVWAVGRAHGPYAQARAVLQALFGKVDVVEDKLR